MRRRNVAVLQQTTPIDANQNDSPSLPERKLSRSILLFTIDQTTLWALSILFTAISGVFLGMSVTKSRPAESLYDDEFWALLCQLCLQILSVYSTIVPVLRDQKLPLRRFWFYFASAASLLTSVLAPIIYVFNWRGSVLASYISGVAALVTSTQLAGAIQEKRETNSELPR